MLIGAEIAFNIERLLKGFELSIFMFLFPTSFPDLCIYKVSYLLFRFEFISRHVGSTDLFPQLFACTSFAFHKIIVICNALLNNTIIIFQNILMTFAKLKVSVNTTQLTIFDFVYFCLSY